MLVIIYSFLMTLFIDTIYFHCQTLLEKMEFL
nr:MAG TPA: hypothetical protein [Caudoviricetes sp.]